MDKNEVEVLAQKFFDKTQGKKYCYGDDYYQLKTERERRWYLNKLKKLFIDKDKERLNFFSNELTELCKKYNVDLTGDGVVSLYVVFDDNGYEHEIRLL